MSATNLSPAYSFDFILSFLATAQESRMRTLGSKGRTIDKMELVNLIKDWLLIKQISENCLCGTEIRLSSIMKELERLNYIKTHTNKTKYRLNFDNQKIYHDYPMVVLISEMSIVQFGLLKIVFQNNHNSEAIRKRFQELFACSLDYDTTMDKILESHLVAELIYKTEAGNYYPTIYGVHYMSKVFNILNTQ